MAERAVRRPYPKQEPSVLEATLGSAQRAARKGDPDRDRSVVHESGDEIPRPPGACAIGRPLSPDMDPLARNRAD
jgi:hypothetical protein